MQWEHSRPGCYLLWVKEHAAANAWRAVAIVARRLRRVARSILAGQQLRLILWPSAAKGSGLAQPV
eukprot:scaffold374853_cov34-Prasinocladus_malaysianus.AAC.1